MSRTNLAPGKQSHSTWLDVEFLAGFGFTSLYQATWNSAITPAWFGYWIDSKIPCRCRMKKHMKMSRSTGQLSEAQNVFRSLPISTECQRIGRRLIGGHWLWVSGMRLPSGDSLLVVSNKDSDPVM